MCQTPTPEDAPKYLKNTVTRPNGRVVHYACTHVDGRRVSLGRYGDPVGYANYEQLRDEWLAARDFAVATAPSRLTVADLAEKYLDHMLARSEAGKVTRTTYLAARSAAEALLAEHAGMPVTRFGPNALTTIQARLVETPCKTIAGRFHNADSPPTLSRTEVNRRVNSIRRIFKWGVARELVPKSIHAALADVEGVEAGDARDNPPRQPSNPAHVRALAAALRAQGHHGHAEALELLRWTGCRPDEVCRLTAGEVAETRQGLELRIRDHKTRKTTGTDRVVPLNAQAAAIVTKALAAGRNIDPGRRLFLSKTGRPFGSSRFYRVLRDTADAADIDRVEPYGLRHLSATEGLEAGMSEVAVAALLGHTPDSTVVRRYSQDRTVLARQAANAIGGREAG